MTLKEFDTSILTIPSEFLCFEHLKSGPVPSLVAMS